MSESVTTTNHEQIKRWAEERGGKPAHVVSTGNNNDPGLLRINFPGYNEEDALENISWDEFFEKFDDNHLAMVLQDRTADGRISRFNRLVSHGHSEKNMHQWRR